MAPGNRLCRVDKTGTPFEVGECGIDIVPALTKMYDQFSRMAVSQGLPPPKEEARHKWIQGLLKEALNFVAVQGDQVVGHSALIPDEARKDGEYIIFVSETFRNRGVGTELTAVAVAKARELDLNLIWLTVESFNFRAIKLYRKTGFIFTDQGERERTMVLRL